MQATNYIISVTRRLTTELRFENRLRTFSTTTSGRGSLDNTNWETPFTWSTGLTKDHFDDEANPQTTLFDLQEMEDKLQELEEENQKSKSCVLLK
ncbi:hypothetical protein RYX36_006141 [Vicia faba]